MADEPTVGYTVKELLAQAEKTADERHAAIMGQLVKIESRVQTLERADQRRVALGAVSNKVFAGAGTLCFLLLAIPGAIIAFGQVFS